RVQWRLLGAARDWPAAHDDHATDVDVGVRSARVERARAGRHQSAGTPAAQCPRLSAHQRSDTSHSRSQPGSTSRLLTGICWRSPMTNSILARAMTIALSACAALAFAQAPAPRPPSNNPVPLDRVVAVVNDEALTQWDIREQKRSVLEQLKASSIA